MCDWKKRVEGIVATLEDKKVEIEYPCIWKYKVIIENGKNVKKIVKNQIQKEYKLKFSNKSKSGKYDSYSLELLVQNEDERTYIYENLKKDAQIKMVL